MKRPPIWLSIAIFFAVPSAFMALKSVIPFWIRLAVFVVWAFFMAWVFIGAMENKAD